MIIALTGTPGTGKTAMAAVLASRGYSVIDLTELAETSGARTSYDEEMDTWEVDLEVLAEAIATTVLDGKAVLDGHLSHAFRCDLVICLRCEPEVLRSRLSERDYSNEKVEENVWAEALSVIAAEARDSGARFEQIDTTEKGPEGVADDFERVVAGESFPPVDWVPWLLDHT